MRVLFEKLTRMIRVLRYLFDVLPNPFVVGFVPFIPRVLLCSPFFFFFLQFLTVFLDFSPLCETKLFLHCSIVWHIDLGVHSGDAGGKRLHWYPWCKLFGSSFVLLDVFLRLVGVFFFFSFVHYSLRLAIIQLVSFSCLVPSLYTTPLAYIRSKRRKGPGSVFLSYYIYM